jgi:hypothetical protein
MTHHGEPPPASVGPRTGEFPKTGGWLRRRWAAALALVVGALVWGVDVAFLRDLMLILPLVYAVTAAIGRLQAAWPVLIASLLLLVGATNQSWVSVDAVIIGVAAAALLTGTALGRARGLLALQGFGVVLFGGLAVLAAEAAPGWARWLVATGWLTHALWDIAHLRARRAVVASYAEWCAVFDLCVAVMLVVYGL